MSETAKEIEVEKEQKKSLGKRIKNFIRYCGFGTPCDPAKPIHRYFMLVFMCLLSFGSYFVYDNPAALQKDMINSLQISYSQFMLQYSLYSWPNVILSMLGGFLIDKVFGIRIGTVVFSSLVCLGQVVYAIGAQFNQFYVMLAGRFIFGLGGENLAVAQNTYVVIWFKGAELNMVFGLLISVSRIGSTVNMNSLNPIFTALGSTGLKGYQKIAVCLWIGLGMCLLSLACAVVLGLFDKRGERILKRKEGKTGEVIRLKDILRFPLSLWLVFIICVFYYITVFPFIGLAVVFYEEKWQLTATKANLANSLVYILSAVASPFLGILVDFTGHNLFWVLFGMVLTLVAHVLYAFTVTLTPIFIAILMGLSYSFLACGLWPMVAFIVPEHQLGTAYGFMQAIQNLGLAVVTYLTGLIVDQKGYLVLEVFNCAMLCIAIVAGILLYIVDSTRNGTVNLSAKKRKQLAKDKEEQLKDEDTTSLDEKEPLIASLTNEYSIKPEPYVSPITARTNDQIRQRYLARTGARLYQPHMSAAGSMHNVGVLK